MPLEFLPFDRFIDQVDLFGEQDGFDGRGLDTEGYNREGFREDEDGNMIDRDGYDENGMRPDRYGDLRDRNGFDQYGYDEDGYNDDGYDADGYDRDGYDEDGEDRYGDRRDADWFNGDPDRYIFYATDEEREQAEARGVSSTRWKPIPGLPYYGMEIELTSDCNSEVRDIILNQYDEFVWAKEDCSVNGFEMPTHPMTYNWAADNFPWRIVRDLKDAGCRVIRDTNGLHIHVSRAGFNGRTHQFRWAKMFYNLRQHIEGRDGLGGRDAERWGRFRDSDRKAQFEVFRGQMANDNGNYRRYDWPQRYAALNLQNEETIEVRQFAATTNPDSLRHRFELVASTVEYTRNLTVAEITASKGWEYEAYRSWLFNNEGTYPVLSAKLRPALTLA